MNGGLLALLLSCKMKMSLGMHLPAQVVCPFWLQQAFALYFSEIDEKRKPLTITLKKPPSM